MGSEFKCWSLGTFSLHSLYFFEPSQEPKKVFPVTFLKVLLLLSFLCMKFKKKAEAWWKEWSLLSCFQGFWSPFNFFPMYAKSILLQRMAFPVVEFLVQGYKKNTVKTGVKFLQEFFVYYMALKTYSAY